MKLGTHRSSERFLAIGPSMIYLWCAWLSFSKMNAINKCVIIWMTFKVKHSYTLFTVVNCVIKLKEKVEIRARKDILLCTAQGMQAYVLIN